jgi:cell division protein ZapA
LKIQIYDQTYNLSADQDEAYIRELAAYVDAKMRAVADATHTIDSVKVAVLAAINITDELFSSRQHQNDLRGPLRERVERCVRLVDKALERTS